MSCFVRCLIGFCVNYSQCRDRALTLPWPRACPKFANHRIASLEGTRSKYLFMNLYGNEEGNRYGESFMKLDH